MSRQSTATTLTGFDLFAADVLDDPYPHLHRLRAAGAFVPLEKYSLWAVTRFDEAKEVLRDHKTFSSAAGVGLEPLSGERRRTGDLINSDPPKHTKMRKVIGRYTTPRMAATLTDTIRGRAAKLLDDGVSDVVTDLAGPLAVGVIADYMGLGTEARHKFLDWARAGFDLMGPPTERSPRQLELAVESIRYIYRLGETRDLAPGSVGDRVCAAADRGELDLMEALAVLWGSSVVAGMDTTVSFLGNLFGQLIDNPSEWDRLAADPAMADAAVEESLRHEPPVRHFLRQTTREVEAGRVRLPAGARVAVLFGAANRDPDRFAQPDRFDISRAGGTHLAFGHGVHTCLGAPFARLQGKVVLELLIERGLRPVGAGRPVRAANTWLRSFRSLPVVLGRR
jgi:cytochrome P450